MVNVYIKTSDGDFFRAEFVELPRIGETVLLNSTKTMLSDEFIVINVIHELAHGHMSACITVVLQVV